ncbi:MAG: hypothetical protein ACREO7_15005 [Pseudoxanthomonas sp.]
MKTLATSNHHLSTVSARKDGVERNVRSSSAIEGVSGKAFRSAATGQYMTKSDDRLRSSIKERRPKK